MRDAEVHIRTVAAVMMLIVVALLFLNRIFRSAWILPISIAMTIMAVIVYFIPRLKK